MLLYILLYCLSTFPVAFVYNSCWVMVQRFSHCSLFHYIVVCWHKPAAPERLTGVPFWFRWWPFLCGSYRTYLLSCHKQYVTDRRALGIYVAITGMIDRETSQCVRQGTVLTVLHRFCVRCIRCTFKYSDNISLFLLPFSKQNKTKQIHSAFGHYTLNDC